MPSLDGAGVGSVLLVGLQFTDPSILGTVTLGDGVDVELDTTTGTKIGTDVTQKLGFWNKTPVVQPAAAGQAAVVLGNENSEISGVTFTAVAAFTNTNGAIGDLAISDPPTEAEVEAFRDAVEVLADDARGLRDTLATHKTEHETMRTKVEELADDVRALSTLLHAIRTALVDSGLIKGAA